MRINIEDLVLDGITQFNLRSSWTTLLMLSNLNGLEGVRFESVIEDMVPYWRIEETLGEYEFLMYRNQLTLKRDTRIDDLGMVGFSSINKHDDRVYLTEGVSDFITMKLTHPHMNVLGMTTLSGTVISKSIIASLFNNICIVSDNDFNSVKNTGILNSTKMKKLYESLGLKVKILLPDSGYKDITDQFMGELREKIVK